MIPVVRRQSYRRSVAAAGAPSYTKAVASFAGSTTRTDFTGALGFMFTIGSGITIHSLGRRKISGNSASHLVFLYDATTGLFLASGKPNLSTGTAGTDVLDSLVSDLALPAGSYWVLSNEVVSSDAWYDANSATLAAGLTLNTSAYITGTPYRNNFSGRVGYKFTPTANQTVTHLGRYKLDPSNTAAHTVYLTDASGTVLGSVSVNLSGQPTGMVYAALASSVSLTGGTSYCVLSDETSGGDIWFDQMVASLASGFTLNSSAYYDTAIHLDTAGKAWPVGFKFGSGSAGFAGMTPGVTSGGAGQAFVFPQFEFY